MPMLHTMTAGGRARLHYLQAFQSGRAIPPGQQRGTGTALSAATPRSSTWLLAPLASSSMVSASTQRMQPSRSAVRPPTVCADSVRSYCCCRLCSSRLAVVAWLGAGRSSASFGYGRHPGMGSRATPALPRPPLLLLLAVRSARGPVRQQLDRSCRPFLSYLLPPVLQAPTPSHGFSAAPAAGATVNVGVDPSKVGAGQNRVQGGVLGPGQ